MMNVLGDVMTMQGFERKDVDAILDVADEVKLAIHDPEGFGKKFKKKYGRRVSKLLKDTLTIDTFFENRTRTKFSFEIAVMKAGGKITGFPSGKYTSLAKGESYADTEDMFNLYGSDAIVMRSKIEGMPRWIKDFLVQGYDHILGHHQESGMPYIYNVPLILNGGDGKNQHPTQCLLDLFTLREIARSQGKELEGMKVALLNDIAHGRTISSLISVAHLYDLELHFASPKPDRFGLQKHHREDLMRRRVLFYDHGTDFLEAMNAAFAAYQSRPQKERVGAGEDLISMINKGQINLKMMEELGDSAPYLLHPRPVDSEVFQEIHPDLNFHPKNKSRAQSANGVYVRIALEALGLGKIQVDHDFSGSSSDFEGVNIQKLKKNSERKKRDENSRSGYIEGSGIVIDHIEEGLGRRLCGVLGLEGLGVPKVVSDYMEVANGRKSRKDMIKIHCNYKLSDRQLEAIALISPDATISKIKNGRIKKKFRPVSGNYVEDLVVCGNDACVSHVAKEPTTHKHLLTGDLDERVVSCYYCGRAEGVKEIYDRKGFKYVK